MSAPAGTSFERIWTAIRTLSVAKTPRPNLELQALSCPIGRTYADNSEDSGTGTPYALSRQATERRLVMRTELPIEVGTVYLSGVRHFLDAETVDVISTDEWKKHQTIGAPSPGLQNKQTEIIRMPHPTVRHTDGTETEWRLWDDRLDVADGHRLTAVMERGDDEPIMVYDHTIDKFVVNHDAFMSRRTLWGLFVPETLLFGVTLIAIFLAWNVLNSSAGLAVIFALWVAVAAGLLLGFPLLISRLRAHEIHDIEERYAPKIATYLRGTV